MLVHQQRVRSSDRRRFVALCYWRPDALHKSPQRGHFCLCVVFIGPFLSSFLDAAFVVWNHWGQDGYWELIRIRLSSNAVSALIIVPLIVTWVTNGVQPLRTASRSRYLEACALFLGLLAVSYAVLYELRSPADLALLFLPAISDLGGGTIRRLGSKHCNFACRLPGDLECIPRSWAILRRNA